MKEQHKIIQGNAFFMEMLANAQNVTSFLYQSRTLYVSKELAVMHWDIITPKFQRIPLLFMEESRADTMGDLWMIPSGPDFHFHKEEGDCTNEEQR